MKIAETLKRIELQQKAMIDMLGQIYRNIIKEEYVRDGT